MMETVKEVCVNDVKRQVMVKKEIKVIDDGHFWTIISDVGGKREF